MNGNKSYNVAHDKKRAQFDRDTLRNETKQNIIITKQFPKHLIIKKNEHLPALQRGAPAVGGQGGKPETKQNLLETNVQVYQFKPFCKHTCDFQARIIKQIQKIMT